jgi:hypothetical protein
MDKNPNDSSMFRDLSDAVSVNRKQADTSGRNILPRICNRLIMGMKIRASLQQEDETMMKTMDNAELMCCKVTADNKLFSFSIVNCKQQ